MTPCPECHCDKGVIMDTRRCHNGSIRRRLVCKACWHRWTTHEGEPPGHAGGMPAGRRSKAARQLSDDEVRQILTIGGSTREISRQVRRSWDVVDAVLRGERYADVHPDLPRRAAAISCRQCDHWSGKCGLGFPDPQEEGLWFASECSSFLKND